MCIVFQMYSCSILGVAPPQYKPQDTGASLASAAAVAAASNSYLSSVAGAAHIHAPTLQVQPQHRVQAAPPPPPPTGSRVDCDATVTQQPFHHPQRRPQLNPHKRHRLEAGFSALQSHPTLPARDQHEAKVSVGFNNSTVTASVAQFGVPSGNDLNRYSNASQPPPPPRESAYHPQVRKLLDITLRLYA